MSASAWRLARLAWRESRTARRRLFFYMSTIAVGVAAIVSIDSFARNIDRSVADQSRTLLGGDIQLSSRHPFSHTVEALLDSLSTHGIINARSTTFTSMVLVPRTGRTRLTQIHGVGPGYPLYGEVTTHPAGRYATLQSGHNALVDPSLLTATGATVGDTLAIGYARFVITGTLADVPGTSGISAALGPRVYLPERDLAGTELLEFGSSAEYAALLRLPAGSDIGEFTKTFSSRLRTQNVQTRTVTDTEQRTSRVTGTLATFIGIVGLVALLLGGIGVASGVRAFVARKIDTVAILRCLGASGNQVLAMYVAQTAVMGLAGAAAGAVLGIGAQYLLPHVFAGLLPVDVQVTPEPIAIASGLLTGGWIAVVFALQPLLALRGISPLQTLRRESDATVLRSRWDDVPRVLIDIALVASVVGVAVTRAQNTRQGFAFAVGIGVVLLILAAIATALTWCARRVLRAGWPYVIRQGIANIYRPANQTRAVMLALGFGVFLVTTLYLVQNNIVHDLPEAASTSGANLLLFDVQAEQAGPLDSLIEAHGYRVVQQAPLVSMRIAAINGRTTAAIAADSGKDRRAGWAVRREYRSTYRDTLTDGEELVAGRWFTTGRRADAPMTEGDTGEVSLDEGVAEELRVKIGDVITWNVQGVDVPTRITSLRSVKWTRFEPNFFAVFPSKVMADAPHQYTILASVPEPAQMAAIQRDVVTLYPNVSSIDLSLITETIGHIVNKVATAVRFMALFSLLVAIPVLFGAVSATRRERIRESVLLKTLGATRAQILRILVTEYALLGALGSMTGLLLAIAASWGLSHFVFHVRYSPALLPALTIAGVMTAISIAIGVVAGRDVFRETAMTALAQQ